MRLTFRGWVTGDAKQLVLNDWEAYNRGVRSLAGKDVTVTLGPQRKGRSGNQNRYMWGVVYLLLSEKTGSSCDEIHEAMKYRHLKYEDPKLGWRTRSTAELSTSEMEDYLERVRVDAAQMDCPIPLPNEVEI